MAYWNLVAFLALQVVLVTRSDTASVVQLTTSGERCVFPFTYKNVSYESCTTKNHHRPWCSTTAKYEGKWGDCEGFTASGVGTLSEGSCAIPFIYQGRVYKSCTTAFHNRPWCSTTVNYDKDKKWGNCADYEPSNLLVTGHGRIPYYYFCAFPFIYNGEEYKSCVTDGNRSPWCSVTVNYDKDSLRRNCTGFYINSLKTTEGQNCAFPFVYRGQHYNFCTNKNHDRLWCSTTTNYDEDKKWGNCEFGGSRKPKSYQDPDGMNSFPNKIIAKLRDAFSKLIP